MSTHTHHHAYNKGLSWAFWLNLLFSVIEVGGGILTNSTAIMADAFHDFIDTIAIGIAVMLEKVSGKKRTETFSYGYKRFTLLAALGMSLFLLAGAIVMVISSVNSFVAPQKVDSMGMLWLAVLGVTINGFAFLRIKSAKHDHAEYGHSHSHSHSHNHNSKAIMLHLLEDVLGWFAVIIGAVIIYFTGWYWIDGLLTLMIAVFIGFNATKNLVSALKVLLQSVPENVNIKKLTTELLQIDGIKDVHDIHVWSLDGTYNIGSLHAVVDSFNTSANEEIQSAISHLMKNNHIQHPTVQIERESISCCLVNC